MKLRFPIERILELADQYDQAERGTRSERFTDQITREAFPAYLRERLPDKRAIPDRLRLEDAPFEAAL